LAAVGTRREVGKVKERCIKRGERTITRVSQTERRRRRKNFSTSAFLNQPASRLPPITTNNHEPNPPLKPPPHNTPNALYPLGRGKGVGPLGKSQINQCRKCLERTGGNTGRDKQQNGSGNRGKLTPAIGFLLKG